MPYKSKLKGLKEMYIEDLETEKTKQSASEVIRSVVKNKNVILRHKKEVISVMIWKITEAHGNSTNGKYRIRYRSEGVLNEKDGKVQHEHVYTRKQLISEILDNPDNLEKILQRAIGYLVTEEEHDRLSKINEGIVGWERYKKAGIKVRDMLANKDL
jgi:hypothetical protein